MKRKLEVIRSAPLETGILAVRGEKVILDLDLAELYGATTKRLNERRFTESKPGRLSKL